MQMDTIRVVNLRPESTGAPPGGSERASSDERREFADMWTCGMRGEFGWVLSQARGDGARVAGRGSRGNGRARTGKGDSFGSMFGIMCAAYANPCRDPSYS